MREKGKTGELSPNFIYSKKIVSQQCIQNSLCSLTNQVKYHTILTKVIITRVERRKTKKYNKKNKSVKCRRTGAAGKNSALVAGTVHAGMFFLQWCFSSHFCSSFLLIFDLKC